MNFYMYIKNIVTVIISNFFPKNVKIAMVIYFVSISLS
jgi:hypothetical protein